MGKKTIVLRIFFGLIFLGSIFYNPMISTVTAIDNSYYMYFPCYDGGNPTGRYNTFYFYLPATSPSPGNWPQTAMAEGSSKNINQSSDTQTRPYSITLSYEFWVMGMSDDLETNPIFTITDITNNNNILAQKQFHGGTVPGSVTILANSVIRVEVNTGAWHWHQGLFQTKQYRGFDCSWRLSYQTDSTAPSTPSLSLTNVKNINGTYYSNLNPTTIHWANPGDPGSGATGVTKYNIYNHGNYVTQITDSNQNIYNLTSEGSYAIQAQAIDVAGNSSPLSTVINVVVDYAPPVININQINN